MFICRDENIRYEFVKIWLDAVPVPVSHKGVRTIFFKKMTLYLSGLIIIAIAVHFGIKASLGLSPVTALGYSISLLLPVSVGIGVFLANFIFIFLQFVITKKMALKDYIFQFLVAFLLGILIDLMDIVFDFLPFADTYTVAITYLFVSIILLSIATFLYTLSQFAVLPFDTLMIMLQVNSKWALGKIRVIADIITVLISSITCYIALGNLGGVGIGTFILAVSVGKIIGEIRKYAKDPFEKWIYAERILAEATSKIEKKAEN